MARLQFPDEGDRLAFRIATNSNLQSAAGIVLTVYTDEAATILADIQTLSGGTITGSVVTIDSNSLVPVFQGPDGEVATLYVKAAGGPVTKITARDSAKVRKNSAGTVFARQRVNLIEGSNVTLTVADDVVNDEVDVTIAAATSGGTVTVRKNTGADVGSRPRLNLIEGSNVTLTVADDSVSNEVDITVAAATSAIATPRPALYVVYAADYPSGQRAPIDSTFTWLCDLTNDEVEINAAIAAAAVNRGEVKLLGPRFKQHAPILAKSECRLSGEGDFTTRIEVATSGASGDGQIKLFDVNVGGFVVENLVLWGANVAGWSGIKWDNTGGTFPGSLSPDPCNKVRRVHIYNSGQYGIHLVANTRDTRVSDVRVKGAGSHGIYNQGPDSHFVNIVSQGAGGHGFYMDGASNMITNCKSTFSGNNGLLNAGSRNNYANNVWQDNAGYGAEFTTGKASIAGDQADSNGTAAGAGGLGRSGFRFAGTNMSATSLISFDRGANATPQQFGFSFTTGCTNSYIQAVHYANSSGAQTGTPGTGTTLVFTG